MATALWTLPVRAQQKFALQLFHFNVQYVCGGTIGFTVTPNPELDLDNDAVEDRIITESLAPVIDLFEAHPSWGVDIEMQAYMLDVLAWRHPAVLDKLRTMAKAGQIDVVSFHYGDQLFIGYPQEDLERSLALVADTFAKHDVPLSPSVFCQEGQSASAMAPVMAAHGYRNMVWPKNLWIFEHGDFDADPLYSFGDVRMVVGAKGVSYGQGPSGIEVVWTFLGDGETLATGGLDPYFPEQFWMHPEAVAAYENKLSALEQQGYAIATVDQYVEAVAGSVTPTDPPPLLDGTWQPDSTGGTRRWLGGSGAWLAQERDNQVRTMGELAHRELLAAETAAAQTGIEARDRLDGAWRLLTLGEVSDGTGINPFRGEVQYAISHFTEALRLAREVIDEGKQALGESSVWIDPAAGTIEPSDAPPAAGTAVDPPMALTIEPGERRASESWVSLGPGHYRVTLDFSAGETTIIGVTFPGELSDELTVSQALSDALPTTISRSAFSFDSFFFALPTGLVGLGGGRYVIKDMGQVHLAAQVWRDKADVHFEDQTAPVGESQRWVFEVLDGSSAEAADLALAINVQRRLQR